MTKYFFLSQYFVCKQADIVCILNKVSKNYRLQISRPGERGVGRVFILDFQVNVANDMWNLGFKGLLHILMLLHHCLQKFPGGGRVFISGPWTKCALKFI